MTEFSFSRKDRTINDEIEAIKELLKIVDVHAPSGEVTYKKSGKPAGCLKPHGYTQIGFKKKLYHKHRVVFFSVHGYLPPIVDHIHGVEAGDGIGNIQAITQSQNCMKRKMRSDNTTGYRGVSFDKNKKRYSAGIKLNGKRISIGYFDTAIEASEAYKAKAKELFGECYVEEHTSR